MIQRSQHVMVFFVPHNVDASAVDCGSRRSITIVLVAWKRGESEILFPFHLAILCAETKHGYAPRPVTSAGQEDFFTPKHGRGMAAPGQLRFPVNRGLRYLARKILQLPNT